MPWLAFETTVTLATVPVVLSVIGVAEALNPMLALESLTVGKAGATTMSAVYALVVARPEAVSVTVTEGVLVATSVMAGVPVTVQLEALDVTQPGRFVHEQAKPALPATVMVWL